MAAVYRKRLVTVELMVPTRMLPVAWRRWHGWCLLPRLERVSTANKGLPACRWYCNKTNISVVWSLRVRYHRRCCQERHHLVIASCSVPYFGFIGVDHRTLRSRVGRERRAAIEECSEANAASSKDICKRRSPVVRGARMRPAPKQRLAQQRECEITYRTWQRLG